MIVALAEKINIERQPLIQCLVDPGAYAVAGKPARGRIVKRFFGNKYLQAGNEAFWQRFLHRHGRPVPPRVRPGTDAVLDLASMGDRKMLEMIFVHPAQSEPVFVSESVLGISVRKKSYKGRDEESLYRLSCYAGGETVVVYIRKVPAELDGRYGV